MYIFSLFWNSIRAQTNLKYNITCKNENKTGSYFLKILVRNSEARIANLTRK